MQMQLKKIDYTTESPKSDEIVIANTKCCYFSLLVKELNDWTQL